MKCVISITCMSRTQCETNMLCHNKDFIQVWFFRMLEERTLSNSRYEKGVGGKYIIHWVEVAKKTWSHHVALVPPHVPVQRKWRLGEKTCI